MRYGQLVDERGTVVVPNMVATSGPLERMRGLLWRPPLNAGDGMLLDRCNAIHTIGMRYPIDAVFIDAAGEVLRVVPALQPRRMAACRRARAVIELAAGEGGRLGILPQRQLLARFMEAA